MPRSPVAPLLPPCARYDVARGEDDAGDDGVGQTVFGGCLQPAPAAVPMPDVEFDRAGRAGVPAHLRQERQETLGLFGGVERADRSADQLLRAIAEQALDGRVDVPANAIGVDDRDDVGDGSEQGMERLRRQGKAVRRRRRWGRLTMLPATRQGRAPRFDGVLEHVRVRITGSVVRRSPAETPPKIPVARCSVCIPQWHRLR